MHIIYNLSHFLKNGRIIKFEGRYSAVTQWQSERLLSAKLKVRVLPAELSLF